MRVRLVRACVSRVRMWCSGCDCVFRVSVCARICVVRVVLPCVCSCSGCDCVFRGYGRGCWLLLPRMIWEFVCTGFGICDYVCVYCLQVFGIGFVALWIFSIWKLPPPLLLFSPVSFIVLMVLIRVCWGRQGSWLQLKKERNSNWTWMFLWILLFGTRKINKNEIITRIKTKWKIKE